jgi:hypothetical protein
VDLDILDATEHYKDTRGYSYVAISDSWKRLCLDLPDSERVQIPPVYRQQSLQTTIDGKPVVIQVWKGNSIGARKFEWDAPGSAIREVLSMGGDEHKFQEG